MKGTVGGTPEGDIEGPFLLVTDLTLHRSVPRLVSLIQGPSDVTGYVCPPFVNFLLKLIYHFLGISIPTLFVIKRRTRSDPKEEKEKKDKNK